MRLAFDFSLIKLCAKLDGKALQLWTVDPEGMMRVKAFAVLEKPSTKYANKKHLRRVFIHAAEQPSQVNRRNEL